VANFFLGQSTGIDETITFKLYFLYLSCVVKCVLSCFYLAEVTKK